MVTSLEYVCAGTNNEYVYCCNAGAKSTYSPGDAPDITGEPPSDTEKYTLGGIALLAAVA
jgi:hypothetical protein